MGQREICKNWEIQKNHYDIFASRINVEAFSKKINSRAIYPALRAPYEFLEKWLMQQDLVGKRILDYGCGTGIHSMFPALRGGYVIGVDISPKSIEVAKKIAVAHGVSKYTSFEIGNCEKLKFATESFDIVYSIGTLSCLDLKVAYSELARVVKRDGTVIILDTLGHNPILNLNRKIKLWRGLKTQWHVDHILKLEDFYKARNYFKEVEIYFFDLTTLILVPFRYHFENYVTSLTKCLTKLTSFYYQYLF